MKYQSLLILGIIAILAVGKISLSVFPAKAANVYSNGLTITQPGIYENLDVSNPNGYCVKIASSNVTLKNSKIHNCYGYGVWVESVHDVQIINNDIWDTVKNTCYPNCSDSWESAIKVRSANQTDKLAYNILVENNRVFQNYGEGIGARGSHVTIRNNVFYDNFSINIYTNGDNTLIERNLVYCTGDSRFNRSGNLPGGISQGDEYYDNWNPSRAYNLTVVNNIVSGCDRGFTYFGAEPGVTNPGLKDSIIAFNTFACTTKPASIRLYYESGQKNVVIHNNIGVTNIDNMSGVNAAGNVFKSFPCRIYDPANFRLTEPLIATGSYVTTSDFFGNNRISPLDAGAIEYNSTSNNTGSPPQPRPGDADNNGQVNEADYLIWLLHYGQTVSGNINGDFNGDNKVDGVDYVILINNFNL